MFYFPCAVATGVGSAASPAGGRLSATAHQATASYPDTTNRDHLSSGRTGKAASLLKQVYAN